MSKLVIIYDSRTASTLMMAEAVFDGAKSVSGVEVVLKTVKNARTEDIEEAAGIILGSPTHADTKVTEPMREFLKKAEKVSLKGKVGAAFGSYVWTDESVEFLTERLKTYGMEVIEPGVTVKVALSGERTEPGEKDLERCRDLGELVARKIITRQNCMGGHN